MEEKKRENFSSMGEKSIENLQKGKKNQEKNFFEIFGISKGKIEFLKEKNFF